MDPCTSSRERVNYRDDVRRTGMEKIRRETRGRRDIVRRHTVPLVYCDLFFLPRRHLNCDLLCHLFEDDVEGATSAF
jgi:hypothetical protein